jgi:Pyruvate/2-oxoacid:ferredoxin oxidoreductase delta subunit
MFSSQNITCYFDLFISCKVLRSKDSEIPLDPELYFDYCEGCHIKCDSGLPHQCIQNVQREEDQRQSQFRILLMEDGE